MPVQRASKTAEIAAAVRAAHRRYDRPVVFDDRYALALTSPGWRLVCRVPALHWLVVRGLMGRFRTIHAEMLGRARYTEDELLRALDDGLRQYVIVGAGLDSFALRRTDLAGRLRVYELDRPLSQAAKRIRLARLGAPAAVPVEFVAVDFERETVAQALSRSSCNTRQPAFFSWLGTTYYLTPQAIESTLRSIAAAAAPGSELVLDFALPAEHQPADEAHAFRQAQAAVARRGEPWRAFYEPWQLAALTRRCGFELKALLTPQALHARYFHGRDDDLRPPAWGHIAHLRVPRRASARP